MKAKFLYIAALALFVSFTACENETPFDTQSEDDAPLILKPYNESWTGSFSYVLASPETPMVDSVTVTPSSYTTVNWIVDGEKVFTGTKIDMCFPGGVHDLVIEAVTTKGKRTERKGNIIVYGGEKELWHGPKNLDWDDKNIRVTKETMRKVAVGSKIRMYFKTLDEQDYYALRVTTPAWGDEHSLDFCLVPQFDPKDEKSPFIFEYDQRCKNLVDSKGGMISVGNGLQILLIDFE